MSVIEELPKRQRRRSTGVPTVAVPLQPRSDEAAEMRERDDATARVLRAALDEAAGRPPLTTAQRALKRTLDVVGAAVLLLVVTPVVLMAVLAVRLDSRGPAFFGQERVGLGGRTFRVWKLRSMAVDNDDAAHRAYVASLITGEAEAVDGMFKLVNDPRVTRVGRVLRRYSVDELPQLWNVLRGDMSLVGPRPALPDEVRLYDPVARQRLAVKPGVTGLWQVSGRCSLTFAEMIALDVGYWQRWSLALDLRILLRTPLAALRGEGAA